jgi:hypothetical protein
LSDRIVGEISHQYAEARRGLRHQRALCEQGGNSGKNSAAFHDGTALLEP